MSVCDLPEAEGKSNSPHATDGIDEDTAESSSMGTSRPSELTNEEKGNETRVSHFSALFPPGLVEEDEHSPCCESKREDDEERACHSAISAAERTEDASCPAERFSTDPVNNFNDTQMSSSPSAESPLVESSTFLLPSDSGASCSSCSSPPVLTSPSPASVPSSGSSVLLSSPSSGGLSSSFHHQSSSSLSASCESIQQLQGAR